MIVFLTRVQRDHIVMSHLGVLKSTARKMFNIPYCDLDDFVSIVLEYFYTYKDKKYRHGSNTEYIREAKRYCNFFLAVTIQNYGRLFAKYIKQYSRIGCEIDDQVHPEYYLKNETRYGQMIEDENNQLVYKEMIVGIDKNFDNPVERQAVIDYLDMLNSGGETSIAKFFRQRGIDSGRTKCLIYKFRNIAAAIAA